MRRVKDVDGKSFDVPTLRWETVPKTTSPTDAAELIPDFPFSIANVCKVVRDGGQDAFKGRRPCSAICCHMHEPYDMPAYPPIVECSLDGFFRLYGRDLDFKDDFLRVESNISDSGNPSEEAFAGA